MQALGPVARMHVYLGVGFQFEQCLISPRYRLYNVWRAQRSSNTALHVPQSSGILI